MKTMRTTMKGLIPVLACSLFFAACSKDNDANVDPNEPAVHYATMGEASGSQMEPPVSTTGSASMVGSYNTGTNKWEYSVSWTALTSNATAIEIHGPGTEGPNSTRIFTEVITNGGQNGARSVTVTLNEEQEKNLVDDKLTFRILTTTYPSGEVNGQVISVTR